MKKIHCISAVLFDIYLVPRPFWFEGALLRTDFDDLYVESIFGDPTGSSTGSLASPKS
jgi:hypothetical protein